MIQRFFTKLVIFDWTLLNISMRFAGTASTSRVLNTFYPLQTCKSNLSSTIVRSKKEDFSNKEELKKRLTPLQYEVTQNAGTERAFTGDYWNNHKRGTYKCVVCKEDLFSSNTKYESGSGWPSFYDVFDEDKVKLIKDSSYGMVRTEVVCAKCKAHLGHQFNDGPNPTGLRYCMNSASLDFVEDDKK